ncbi:MAG: hypothetical protein R3B13_02510 [Polyangiaceae bacterium]
MRNPMAWALVVAATCAGVACAQEDDDGIKATGGFGGVGATGGSATGGSNSGGFGNFDSGVGGTSSGGASGASGSSGAGGQDAGPTVSVSGRTLGLVTVSPIAGFSVCLYQVPSVPCVTSDTNGNYTLPGVPANSEVLLEYKLSGYLNVLRTVTTGAGNVDVGVANYPSTAEANAFASLVGTTIDPTKGQVLFSAFQPGTTSLDGQDGVTASMSPTSGSGPHYINSGPPLLPDSNLTATDTIGFGLYANVSPGNVEITLTHPTKTCQRLVLASFAGSGPTVSKVPVVAGYLTAGAALECP